MAKGTRPENAIEQPLTLNGLPTGVDEANGDYSSVAGAFYFQNTTRAAVLTRMIVSMVDSGSLDSGFYGNNIVLTQGISIVITDSAGSVKLNLLPEGNIFTNGDWARKCHDFTRHDFGLGDEVGSARWTFSKDLPSDGFLLGAGDKFTVILNDNFGGLVAHRFDIRGEYVTTDG